MSSAIGQIRALEPLPSEWEDARELHVLEADSRAGSEEPDTWRAEMDVLAAGDDDPENWARVEAAFAEADLHAKWHVRRQMGLP